MKKLFTVYDRYIFKQVLATTLIAILLFTIVWIAPEMLLKVIKHILTGETTLKTGILILLCEIPKILGKAFPVGLLLGTLFTFDKLSKDSELTIFRAVGMSFERMFRPVLVLSIIFTILCFITYDKLIPFSCQKLQSVKGDVTVTQFIYTQNDDYGHPREAIIVSRFYKGAMSDVIVMDFNDKIYDDFHGLENVLVGETGYKGFSSDGTPCWILNDITSYNIDENGIFQSVKKIPRMEVLHGEAAESAYNIMINSVKRDRDLTNRTLKRYVSLLKLENFEEEYRLNYNKYLQRFFHPLVCILLALMGCLLGFSKPREQRLIGFTIAIGTIFVYYITLPFFDLLAEKGVLHPLITAIFPLLAFMAAVIAFYKTRDL